MKAQRRQSMRASQHLADGEPLRCVQRGRVYSMHLRQGPAQPEFRKVADVVRYQFFFSAFLRCMVSGRLPPPWLHVPVIAEASLFNVPSKDTATAFTSIFTVSPVRAMLFTTRLLTP